ncbi:MAG: C40 family peptidase [Chitinophagales bacterium]
MKKLILLFTCACIPLTVALDSCHSSHHVAYRSSKQPKFIDDVYIAPHNKSNATANAIDHRKAPEKARSNTKVKANNKDQDAGKETTIHISSNKVNKVAEPNVVRKKYSEMLGVKPKEITNFSLYQFIDKWYGTDYRLGGHDKSGIDCSGFAQKLYVEVYGIDLLRTATEQFSNCKRIKRTRDAEEGDLVFFHVRGRRISHVGVYLANDYFVHASTSNGVIISNLNEEYWHKCYAGCGRVPRGG